LSWEQVSKIRRRRFKLRPQLFVELELPFERGPLARFIRHDLHEDVRNGSQNTLDSVCTNQKAGRPKRGDALLLTEVTLVRCSKEVYIGWLEATVL
jgi:hypothetical protein